MKDDDVVRFLNSQWPPAVQTLKGHATHFCLEQNSLGMEFETKPEFCHSGDIVQGGYISGMLDAVMAFAAIGPQDICDWVATLEIKVNFLAPGRNGKFVGSGRVVHSGRSIGYLSGELFQNSSLVATATSTVKLIHSKV
jgi:uncharacterized protein (TIGR00369 family)